eukprot:EG_transcript_14759
MAAWDPADRLAPDAGRYYDSVPTLETDSSASAPRGLTADAALASLERQHRLELQMEQDNYKRLLREMAEKYERRLADLEGALQTARAAAAQRGVSDRLQAVLDQQEQEIDELLCRLQESEQEVAMLREKVRLLQQPRHPDHPQPGGHEEQASALKAALDGVPRRRQSPLDDDRVAARPDLCENTALARLILQRDLGVAGTVPGTLTRLLLLISERCADVMATLTTLRDFTTAVGELVWNYDDGAASESSHVDGEPVLAVELRNLQRRLHAILHGKESAAPQPRRGWASGGGPAPLVPRCASAPRRRPNEGVAPEKRQEMLQSAGLLPKPRSKPQGWDNSLFKPKEPFRN